jgi:hypothetical protein
LSIKYNYELYVKDIAGTVKNATVDGVKRALKYEELTAENLRQHLVWKWKRYNY